MINSIKSVTNVFHKLTITNPSITIKPNLFVQQARTTFILKRRKDVPLSKKYGEPRKMKSRHFIYDLVDNLNLHPHKPIDVILTEYVETYGEKGDQISLKPNTAYKYLLLPKKAVYATPENIKKYVKTGVKTYSSKYAPITMNFLARMVISVKMSLENPWILEKRHIKTNFRKAGIYIKEDAITIPSKEISGPNLDIENKEFYVIVTINKTEEVKVRCRIHHYTLDEEKQIPLLPDFDKYPTEPIFLEDKEVLDSMPNSFVKKE